jgi:hypothetical protein
MRALADVTLARSNDEQLHFCAPSSDSRAVGLKTLIWLRPNQLCLPTGLDHLARINRIPSLVPRCGHIPAS